jgi:hypothetical protein
MWETRFGDRTELAYLLQWPDETTKTAAWHARGMTSCVKRREAATA